MSSYHITNSSDGMNLIIDEGFTIILDLPTKTNFEVDINDPAVAQRWEELKEQIDGFAEFLKSKNC